MSWLFGQTWIWYLIAFAVGVLVAWLLFVRPAQRRLNTLRAAGGGPTGDAAADDKTSVLDRGKLGAVAAGTATAGAAGAALAAARGGSGADAEADEATGATVDDAPTEQIPAVDPALATLDTSSIGMVSPTEATTEIPVVEPEVDAPTSVLSTAGADATEADADGEASVDSNGHGGAGAAAALGAAGLGAAGLAAGGSEDESEATAVSSDTSEDATTAIPHTAVTAEASGDVASVSEVVAEEGTDSDATTALGVAGLGAAGLGAAALVKGRDDEPTGVAGTAEDSTESLQTVEDTPTEVVPTVRDDLPGTSDEADATDPDATTVMAAPTEAAASDSDSTSVLAAAAAGAGAVGIAGVAAASAGAAQDDQAGEGPYGPGSAHPGPDGSAPGREFKVKADTDTMAFHSPMSPTYDDARADVWFSSIDTATAAGFTAWFRRPATETTPDTAAESAADTPAGTDPDATTVMAAPPDAAAAAGDSTTVLAATAAGAGAVGIAGAAAASAGAGAAQGAEAGEGPYGPGSAHPGPDGSAPGREYKVKADTDTMAFHSPMSPTYDDARADVWFSSIDTATAAGFTAWFRRPATETAPDTDPETATVEPGDYPASAKPNADGSAPHPEYEVKANAGSKRYHTTESPYYVRTTATAWFRTAADAEAAGFTAWGRS